MHKPEIIQCIRDTILTVLIDEDMTNEIIKSLLKNLGGQDIYIPTDDINCRNSKIKSYYHEGMSVEKLAYKFRLHKKTICRVIKKDATK